ncbi:hypothetical protein AAAC51_06880 [Priestia megaterium]
MAFEKAVTNKWNNAFNQTTKEDNAFKQVSKKPKFKSLDLK